MTATEPRKGLIASILRPADLPDCSLNGISARYTRVVIVGVRAKGAKPHRAEGELLAAQRGEEELPRIFTAGDTRAEVELVVRHLGGGIYVHAEPVEGNGRWAMASGAYIDTSDSRFGEMLRAIYRDGRSQVGPIPLHDRYES